MYSCMSFEKQEYLRLCAVCETAYYLKDCTIHIPKERTGAVWVCPKGHENPSIAR